MSKDETEVAETEAPKKSKKKLLMIIVIAIVVLGGGGGAYFMFAGGGEEPAPEAGEVIKLDAITINLAEGHYLKLGLALQATADVSEAPDGSKALDLAIHEYTDMEISELSTAKGRDAAKAELLENIKEAYEDEIMNIYFTQFVTQ
jgi:flagellar FliL protein